MYFLYSTALAVFAALAFPYFLFQGLRHGKYLRSFLSRWGRLPAEIRSQAKAAPGAIWLHAVSVGEALACRGLVAALRARFPERKLFVSTTTETGFRTAQQHLAANGFFFCPLDFAFAVRRVLRTVRPSLVVIAETEFWPNLFRQVRASGALLAVVNARISDRSFPRYRLFQFFFRRVLQCADLLLAQSEEDARRLRKIGAPPTDQRRALAGARQRSALVGARVEVTGTLKYDLPEPAPLAPWLAGEMERWSAPGALLAGSTAAGEEEPVLEAYARLHLRRPALRLILVPRRPERFDQVAALVQARGFLLTRRSHLSADRFALTTDVLLVDTVGELAALYRYASVAFVGGSLVPHGGQNPLEAAVFARPLVVGPHMSNFREITAGFLAAGAMRQVKSAAELPEALEELFADPVRAREMGERARALLEASRGATARTVEALLNAECGMLLNAECGMRNAEWKPRAF